MLHGFFFFLNKNIKITIKNYDVYSILFIYLLLLLLFFDDEAKQTVFYFLQNLYILIMRSGQEPCH